MGEAVKLLGCFRVTGETVAIDHPLPERLCECLAERICVWRGHGIARCDVGRRNEFVVRALELQQIVETIEPLQKEVHLSAGTELLWSHRGVVKPEKPKVRL